MALVTGSCSICPAADWNQFRGPNRDGKSVETGLLKEWPNEGPVLLWSYEGLGQGFASVAVVDGTVYTTGMNEENQGMLFAIDRKGALQWEKEYGPEWSGSYPGSRTTPTVDDERIYLMSGNGRLCCFDRTTGALIWKVDTLEKFQGKNITWGISESVLIDGDKVICTPGGQDATLVALNKHTGKTIWTSEGLSNPSAYCSPIAVEHNGKRLLLTMIKEMFVCLNRQNGKVLWTIPHKTRNDIAAISPLYSDGYIYFTSHDTGGRVVKLSQDGAGYSDVWTNPKLDSLHGGVILHDGRLYGSDTKKRWLCQDFMTGRIKTTDESFDAKGSLIYAEDMLVCYSEKGMLSLVKITPEGMATVSSFEITLGTKEHWAHPVISDGRLYIRRGDTLMAYAVKDKEPQRPKDKTAFFRPASEVMKLADGFIFTEGPAVDARGNVYFSDIPNSRIHKWSLDGRLSTFIENSGRANGLFFDKGGNLLACAGGSGQLVSIDRKKKIAVLADKYEGKAFNSPNDLWLHPGGGIYFTDPRYGNRDNLPQDGEHVYYLSADRRKVIRVVNDMVRPNGLVGTPDGMLLYIADEGSNKTYSYEIEPDGTLTQKKLFVSQGSDGMTIDNDGRIYLTRKAVSIFDPEGNLVETIEVPEAPANVCFGGKNKTTLFITARKSLYSIAMNHDFYSFAINDIDGIPVSLSQFQGNVLLVVNVASQCGYTKQYAGLQELYDKYKDQGLAVLGFPANDFGSQEPGTNSEIKHFCTTNYSVTFPMFSKISVKGRDIHPLYRYLTAPESNGAPAKPIAWNFNKFLIGQNGKTIARFESNVDPLDSQIIGAVEKALKN